MPKNRLHELQKEMPDSSGHVDLDMPPEECEIINFLADMNNLRDRIDHIEELTKEVKKLQEKIMIAANDDDHMRKELEERMDEIKPTALKIKTYIKKLNTEIENEEKELVRQNVEFRLRKTQVQFFSKKFSDVIGQFYKLQSEYKEQCKNRIKRQLEITGKDLNDEQIDEMLESNNANIFTGGVVSEMKMAKQTLADVEARHKDLMNLEKSIIELHEMFMDLAFLIESQGEKINRIEYNMQNTLDAVIEGRENLKVAEVNAKSARKKKVIVGIIILAVLIVIGVIIAIVVTQIIPKK